MSDIYAAPETELTQTQTNDLVEIAIGPENTEYYLQYFESSEASPWQPMLNWPAFLLTSYWLLYRKVWGAALCYILVLPVAFAILSTVAGSVIGETIGTVIEVTCGLAVFFGFPLYCNALYRRKVYALVEKAQRLHADLDAQRAYLIKHGGIGWFAVLAYLLIPIVAVIVVFAAIANSP